MRWVWRILGLILLVLIGGGGWVAFRLNSPQPLTAYDPLRQPAAAGAKAASGPGSSGLRVTFLGVSSLLFDDGETAILTDGFFTRPPLLETLLTKVEPNKKVVDATLERAGIKNLAAVIALHSHYDHAMDAPYVAEKTGALLVGSNSTKMLGLGWGLPENRILIPKEAEPMPFGNFKVTMLKSVHIDHGIALGEITEPLKPPARVFSYRDGGAYSVLIEHNAPGQPSRSMLVQGSAGFIKGLLAQSRADVVFLGIGALGTQKDAYRDEYWREVVAPVKPKRVIPIHWDDFTKPLAEPLRALPWPLDNVPVSLDFLIARSKREGVDLLMPTPWELTDPFAGFSK